MGNEIYFGYDLLPQEALEHYGMPRRSGRYPWGSGEDPYHHGASAPGGKQRSNKPKSLSIGERIKRRKAAKAAVEKAKADAAARQAKEEHERQKKEALESGDPKRLAPFINDLSDSELKSATERMKIQNDFADKISASAKYQKSTADKVNAAVEKLTTYTNTGINAWNAYAKLHNAFRDPTDPSSKELPVIGSTSRASIREAELKKIDDAYDKARKRRIEDEGREAKRLKERMELESQRLGLLEKRAQIEQLRNGGNQQQISDGGGKKNKKNNQSAENSNIIDVTPAEKAPEKTPEEREQDLRKKWADEANAIANRGKEARRSDEVREMANEYAKQIALQEEAARRKSLSDDVNESLNRGAEARRSEEVRELANEYAKQIAMLEEANRRKSWTDDANKTADRGAEARRSEEVRELANEYARQIAMLEEARRRKNMKFY